MPSKVVAVEESCPIKMDTIHWRQGRESYRGRSRSEILRELELDRSRHGAEADEVGMDAGGGAGA
jgi:hypothetical protein